MGLNVNLKKSIKRPPITQRKPKVKPPEPNYPKCKALYNYVATESDELSFNENDIIYITVQEDPNGWWTGICKGKTGNAFCFKIKICLQKV